MPVGSYGVPSIGPAGPVCPDWLKYGPTETMTGVLAPADRLLGRRTSAWSLVPSGSVIVACDQVSYLPGWQEGAMLSARYVLQRISRGTRLKATAAATTKRRAPDTRALTQGSGRTRN